MCGIVGALQLDRQPVSPGAIRRMTEAIAHRGPDGEGHFVEGPVGLGHRRLAVIDLSAAGHQPMTNEGGDVFITYSGEVYNFEALRIQLEAAGHRFHSRTDSEVVVHAYEEWGDDCVARFNGMFAFAIWDKPRRTLFLARDRFGIKPLYWYVGDGALVFGSEIKAILQYPGVRRDVCYGALDEYFSFQNVFSDRTLFDGVRLLPPGHALTVRLDEPASIEPRRYWDFPAPDESSPAPDAREAAEQVHSLFVNAVTRQLVSDVPIGSYLSGGLDSGAVTTVAAGRLPRLNTFTCGFDLSSASGLELGFDERHAAEVMANRLKSEHYEVVMHAGDMEWVLPELIWHLEDLRVGQSYPNYYVARLASRFVKVVLSGAGGDELFGGYPWRYYRGITDRGRDDYLARYYGYWQRLVPDEAKGDLFTAETRRSIGDGAARSAFNAVFDGYSGPFDDVDGYLGASLYFELKTFLPGLLLVEDKLSMAHGLETRVPFLDNDLVDYAVRLPASLKIRNLDEVKRLDENDPLKRRLMTSISSDGKAILRDAMASLVPSDTAERAKQGFSAPDASWFRGESIDYITRLLGDRKAMLYEFIQPAYVKTILDEHTSGHVNHRLLIWSFLSFEWWCRTFLSGAARDAASPRGRSGASAAQIRR
jgi:asparagine synthase (glutamine-hydrolysing)